VLRFAVIPIAAGLAVVSAQSFAGVAGMGVPFASQDPAATYAAARQRLASAPLDADSYYALAVAAQQAGEIARARQLMDQALAIAPRMRAARLWLMRQAALAGDVPEVITQARVVARLSPRTIPEVSEVLAQLAATPEHRALIAARFANEPMIIATARQAPAHGLSAEAVMELLAPTDLARMPKGVETAQAVVARALLAEQRPAEARSAWLRIGGHSDAGAVFDGSFAGLAGAPPFGWSLHSGANVETAIEPGAGPAGAGALRAETFSSLALDVAEQSLALPPGSYRLRFSAASDDAAQVPQSFVWTVDCAPRRRLVEIALAPAPEWSQQTGSFVVPAGCPLQVLRLAKLRTADQGTRTVAVSRVSIDPA
jgi:tetratricopeptide (TPR) repeat protein